MPERSIWPEQYRGVGQSIRLYWDTYGGRRALLRSPYLHVSVVAAVFLMGPLWACTDGPPWHDIALDVIPNLLGFTLGGYAILLAFGDEAFRRAISGPKHDGSHSPFMTVNSTFIHFIVVQALTILVSIFSKAWGLKTGVFALVGSIIFIYAILTGVAAALAVLNLAKWFDWTSKGQGQERPSEK